MQDGSKDTIGVYLQRERMKRNIGLQDVTDATGISIGVLKALEEEDRAKLPSEVYIKAFYKKYADFLGLSSDEVVAPAQQPDKARQSNEDDKYHFRTIVELKSSGESSYDNPIRLLLILILVVFCGGFFYWAYTTDFNPLQFFGNLFGSLELQEHMHSNVG